MLGPNLLVKKNENFNKEFLNSRNQIEILDGEEKDDTIDQKLKIEIPNKRGYVQTKSATKINLIYAFSDKSEFSQQKSKKRLYLNKISLYSQILVYKALKIFKSFSTNHLYFDLKEFHFKFLNEFGLFDLKKNSTIKIIALKFSIKNIFFLF